MSQLSLGKIEHIELALLLEAIEQRYGYDFKDYAQASLMRRVKKYGDSLGIDRISGLITDFLYDSDHFFQFIQSLSVVVTELFRDPEVFAVLKQDVMPILSTYPFIKIWHAGCGSGQEVYSFAILLHEAGLLERCQIYATDLNDEALQAAKAGIYPQDEINAAQQRYQQAGGQHQLSDYFTERYGSAKAHKHLRERITFANHNLVTDGVFGEMHAVLCRNVLIYFNEPLQDRALDLITKSLVPGGVLCIGRRETIKFSPVRSSFINVNHPLRVYKKAVS